MLWSELGRTIPLIILIAKRISTKFEKIAGILLFSVKFLSL